MSRSYRANLKLRNLDKHYTYEHGVVLRFCAIKTKSFFSPVIDEEDLMQECWYLYARHCTVDVLRKNIKTVFECMFGIAKRWLNSSFKELVFDNPDNYAQVTDAVEQTDEFSVRRNRLELIIAELPLVHQLVIRWYEAGVNFQKIGRLVGMTGEGCRQIVMRFSLRAGQCKI